MPLAWSVRRVTSVNRVSSLGRLFNLTAKLSKNHDFSHHHSQEIIISFINRLKDRRWLIKYFIYLSRKCYDYKHFATVCFEIKIK